MNANVEFSNFNCICRFCLTEFGSLNVGLFTEEDRMQANIGGSAYNCKSESLKEMVKLCIGMDISPQDNLPQSMCPQCLDKLLQCNKFRLDCYNAEKILKNALLIHKIIKIGPQEEHDAYANDVCNNEEGEQQIEIEDELSSISSGSTDLDEHERNSGEQFNENCKSNTSNSATNSMESAKTKIEEGHMLKNVMLKRIGDKTNCISVESYQTSEMQESVLNSESDVTTDSTDRFETETVENSFMPEGELAAKIEAEPMSFLIERFQTSEMQESVLNDEYAVDIIRGNTEIDENVNPEVEIGVISDNSQINERKSTLRKRYECLQCKKKFIHEADYKEHIKIGCYKNKCSVCEKSFQTKMKKYLYIERKKKIANICRLCGVQFLMKSKLKEHFDINHPCDKPYKCRRCYKVFEKWQRMIEHNRKKITCFPKTNLCCKLCKVQFPTPYKLEVHSRIHNSSEYSYKCKFCYDAFNNLANLKNHRKRNHPTGIPYKCVACAELFENFKLLEIHEEVHR